MTIFNRGSTKRVGKFILSKRLKVITPLLCNDLLNGNKPRVQQASKTKFWKQFQLTLIFSHNHTCPKSFFFVCFAFIRIKKKMQETTNSNINMTQPCFENKLMNNCKNNPKKFERSFFFQMLTLSRIRGCPKYVPKL